LLVVIAGLDPAIHSAVISPRRGYMRAMEETTRELIGNHVASGARLMARQKQIIAELKERGVDATEAERTLAMLSACLRVLEEQWLKLWKERK